MDNKEFIYLTTLRGLAALWVGVHHAFLSIETLDIYKLDFLSMFIMKGWLGVDLFFILSGFILIHSYQDRMQVFSFQSAKKFLINRFARIYPLHFFVMFVFGAVVFTAEYSGFSFGGSHKYTSGNFFNQLFLLHGIGLFEPVGWNIATWSISSECLAYALFPFLVTLRKWITMPLVSFLMILSIFVLTVTMGWFLNDGKKYMLDHQLSGVRILSEFVIGICLYQIYLALKKNYVHLIWLILGVVGLFVQTLIVKDSFYDFLYLCYFILIILSLSLLPQTKEKIPFFSLFGKISYSFYLTHSLIIIGLNQLIRKFYYLELSASVILLVFILITFYISWLLYEKIERPGKEIVLSKLL